MDVHLVGLGFGPYLEVPLSEKWLVRLEGELGLGILHGDFEVNSTTRGPSGSVAVSTASARGSDAVFGGAIGLAADYGVSEKVSVYGGIRYQYFQDFKISDGATEASLEIGGNIAFSSGLVYRF